MQRYRVKHVNCSSSFFHGLSPKCLTGPLDFYLIISLAIRSQADGRKITKVMDPENIGIDVEEVMADVEKRGERTDRKSRR